jgi:para-aminobenzoate synthetase
VSVSNAAVRVLVVDNYDSFTYNLVQAFAALTGVRPLVVRNDECAWADLPLAEVDAIALSPGPGTPMRDADLGISRDAVLQTELPLLAVCLGHQAMAYLGGGRIAQAPQIVHGGTSPIVHDGDPLFRGIPSGFLAVRYHSLVVEDVPPALEPIAWTEDGLVMALRHRTAPQWGVQFHPESIGTEHGVSLLGNFLHIAAGSRRPRRAARPPAAVPRPRAARNELRLWVETVPLDVPAEAVFRSLFRRSSARFWLDSSRVGGDSSFSYLAAAEGPRSTLVAYDVAAHRTGESIFDYLERSLGAYTVDDGGAPFGFHGGYVGYFGYETKADLGARSAHRSPYPDALLALVDRFVAVDHRERVAHLVAVDDAAGSARAARWLRETRSRLAELRFLPAARRRGGSVSAFVPDLDRREYLDAIAAAQETLREGESYEICLTTQFRAWADLDPLELYSLLREINPAPYAAFVEAGDLAILCSSPERFLRVDRRGVVETKPIKGTAPRLDDPAEDALAARALRESPKTAAENLMITDVLRNDLGRVARPGTVRVPVFLGVESYATVHQLVSTVRAELDDGATAVDCLRAAFPSGSMTGAPRLRTMSIVDSLEPRARGIYSGSLGYLSFSGTADLNVVIRTMVLRGHELSLGVGGAITIDSDPDDEVDEVALKARAQLDAVQLATGEPAAVGGGWTVAAAVA